MVSLPPLPARVAALKRDGRGYPVPWFVTEKDRDGEPDFRLVTPARLVEAWRKQKCWVCGQPLGRYRIYPIGPMCVVNRVTSEPPSHRDCATFAAKACPFLSKPRMRRNPKDMPAENFTAGIMIERNPGMVCLYSTGEATPFDAGNGHLIQLGKPDWVEWWTQGREASRAEVEAAVAAGWPTLARAAELEGPGAVADLEKMRRAAEQLYPKA